MAEDGKFVKGQITFLALQALQSLSQIPTSTVVAMKASTEILQMNGHNYVPVTPYLQNQVAGCRLLIASLWQSKG